MNETKNVLKDALKDLLEKYPLDKITINDIVGVGHVNRNTFYYHFDDIYDLIDYLFRCEVEELFEINKLVEEWEDDIALVMKYLINHKNLIYHLYFSINREDVERGLFKFFNTLLTKIVANNPKENLDPEEAKVLIEFYSYGITGKLLSWISHKMDESPDELIERIKLVLRPLMEQTTRQK